MFNLDTRQYGGGGGGGGGGHTWPHITIEPCALNHTHSSTLLCYDIGVEDVWQLLKMRLKMKENRFKLSNIPKTINNNNNK
ncbi:hypothetical protein BLOT_005354 [Blomia tropicalis]|nr:hypothetical protein BLOT_005354 [Blomia tropicalis]